MASGYARLRPSGTPGRLSRLRRDAAQRQKLVEAACQLEDADLDWEDILSRHGMQQQPPKATITDTTAATSPQHIVQLPVDDVQTKSEATFPPPPPPRAPSPDSNDPLATPTLFPSSKRLISFQSNIMRGRCRRDTCARSQQDTRRGPARKSSFALQSLAQELESIEDSLLPSSKRSNRLKVSARLQIKKQQQLELESQRQAALRARQEALQAAEREAQLKTEQQAAQLAREKRQAEEQRATRLEPDEPVITLLPPAWNDKVQKAMASPHSRELALTSTGTNLLRKDFGTLLPQRGSGDSSSGWLNDEIIAAGMQHIIDYAQQRCGQKRGETPKYHAFNSFFYKNLAEKGPESVRRWATKAKIGGARLLECDMVFVPVHQGAHWTLLLILPRRRRVEYFDSLHGSGGPFLRNARAWLAHELGAAWIEDDWTIAAGQSPAQMNGSDCGVFTITTAKMAMLGWEPIKAYGHNEMPLQRRRIAAELLNGGWQNDLAPIEPPGRWEIEGAMIPQACQ